MNVHVLERPVTSRLGRRQKDMHPDRLARILSTAWITGFASHVVDPEDPFPGGFTFGDIC